MARGKKLSVSEIASIVESEGLGHTIEHLVTANKIKDEDLADLWERTSELLEEIASYLDDNADDVDDSDESDDERDEEEEY